MAELSRAEARHLAALHREHLSLALVNERIVLAGGQMIALADGTPAPPPRRTASARQSYCPHGHGRAIDCPHCSGTR
jgi:hypothetical protein